MGGLPDLKRGRRLLLCAVVTTREASRNAKNRHNTAANKELADPTTNARKHKPANLMSSLAQDIIATNTNNVHTNTNPEQMPNWEERKVWEPVKIKIRISKRSLEGA